MLREHALITDAYFTDVSTFNCIVYSAMIEITDVHWALLFKEVVQRYVGPKVLYVVP